MYHITNYTWLPLNDQMRKLFGEIWKEDLGVLEKPWNPDPFLFKLSLEHVWLTHVDGALRCAAIDKRLVVCCPTRIQLFRWGGRWPIRLPVITRLHYDLVMGANTLNTILLDSERISKRLRSGSVLRFIYNLFRQLRDDLLQHVESWTHHYFNMLSLLESKGYLPLNGPKEIWKIRQAYKIFVSFRRRDSRGIVESKWFIPTERGIEVQIWWC